MASFVDTSTETTMVRTQRRIQIHSSPNITWSMSKRSCEMFSRTKWRDCSLGGRKTYKQSSVQEDFEQAIVMCDDMFRDAARNWLEETKAGRLLRLHDERDSENWREEQGVS